MPYEHPLPEPWATRGWKAKIYDLEPPDEPHVTVLFRGRAWRFGLRSLRFKDKEPPEREVPEEVVNSLLDGIADLVTAWDTLHPSNVVKSPEPEAEEMAKKPKTKKSKKRRQK